MRHANAFAVCLACTALSACNADAVNPGFYGEVRSDEQAVTMAPSAAGAAGRGAPPMAADAPAASVAGDDAALEPGGEPTDASDGDPGAEPSPSDDAEDPCDVGGRWLVTYHSVTDALGNQQTAHTWLYYEIERDDQGFVITKGLHCGDDVVGLGAFPINADFHLSRDAVRQRIDYSGLRVRSAPAANGCSVAFERRYVVRGATVGHYEDPSLPLPGPDQPATGSTPGWEDWDEDGNPGITLILTGTIAGKVFIAPRTWFEPSGEVPQMASPMRLPLQWNQETNLLGFDGSPLLTTQGVRAADPNLHFAELARLPDGQATGSDLEICDAVLELAPNLTPSASGI